MLTEHGPDINFTKTDELHSVISLHVFSEYIGGSLNYYSQYIFKICQEYVTYDWKLFVFFWFLFS